MPPALLWNRHAINVEDGDHFAAGSGAVHRETDEGSREDLGFGHIRRPHTYQGDDDHFGKQGMQLMGGGGDEDGGNRAVDGTSLGFRSNKSLERYAARSECGVLAAP